MTTITTQKKLLSLLISQALIAPTQAAVIDINCGDVTGLINAINTANSNIGADEINLNVDAQVNCVYPLTVVDNNTDGANGLPSIITPITINGNQSAIRRQGSEEFRIVYVASTGNLTLKQLSINNGLVNLEVNWSEQSGGGIFNHGELTLEESSISGNTANWYGGGIYNWYSTTTLTNSMVSENIAHYGGGIYNYKESTATFTNSTISRNTASGNGGGIHNYASTATLTNSTVFGNIANQGGGIFNNYSIATLKNTILAGNTANLNPDCFNNNGNTNS
jgi:parallel beta-helix repeat protein